MEAVLGVSLGAWRTVDCEEELPHTNHCGVAQVMGNRRIEDRFSVQQLDGYPMLGLAVFDGHGGWQVAEFLCEHLVPEVGERIKGLQGDPIAVSSALRDAFDDCDARLKVAAAGIA